MTIENNKIDVKIVEFLDKNGPSFLGEVVKELKISNTTGLKRIFNLLSKGVIRRSVKSLQYELNSNWK